MATRFIFEKTKVSVHTCDISRKTGSWSLRTPVDKGTYRFYHRAPIQEQAMVEPRTITILLKRWHEGDSAATGELMPLVYDELRRLAGSYLRHERDLALCRTELVHELYLKLPQGIPELENRKHFYGIAARMMRQILVDLARRQKSQKRQPSTPTVSFSEGGKTPTIVDVLILDECLNRLEALDPRKARIVELRSFGGMSVDETGEALGLSTATVKREWTVARLWLRRELDGGSTQQRV
jgi:RNA polymerase sigma factor (TIGR02999 family)